MVPSPRGTVKRLTEGEEGGERINRSSACHRDRDMGQVNDSCLYHSIRQEEILRHLLKRGGVITHVNDVSDHGTRFVLALHYPR